LITKEVPLSGGLFIGSALAAFSHNGLVKAASEVFWELINLVIPVNFDGFLGGIHHHMAFVAPMEMFIQFHLQVLGDLAIKVVG
jgi:hypothetical protein